jgi:hypothetical protein
MFRSSQGSSKWVEDPEVPANGQDCDGTNAFKLLSGHISPALQVPPGKPTRQCKDTKSIANMGQAIQTASILSQSRQAPRPSMLIAMALAISRPVNAVLVNWLP